MENRVQILKLENTDFMRLSTNMGGGESTGSQLGLKGSFRAFWDPPPPLVPIIETQFEI